VLVSHIAVNQMVAAVMTMDVVAKAATAAAAATKMRRTSQVGTVKLSAT
jgi:hypothetical protein